MSSIAARALAIAAAIPLLAACAAPGAGPAPDPATCRGQDRPLVIATGSPTGVYAVFGQRLAEQVAATTALRATTTPTASTLRNVQQLASGEYDVAFAPADGVADAVRGQGLFAEPRRIQALARIYSDYVHVVVTKASGIRSMAELRGRRISTGAPASGTELLAGRLLSAAGLDPKRDVVARSLDLPTTVAAIRGGSVDAFVWSGGLPTDGVAQLFATDGANLELLDVGGLLPALHAVSDSYHAGVIPAATYHTPADVPTVALANLLVVRDDFPADDACALTRVLFEKRAELAAATPAAAELDPRRATDTAPVQLNPGARAVLDRLGTG